MEKILHTTQRSFFVNMSVVFRFFGFSVFRIYRDFRDRFEGFDEPSKKRHLLPGGVPMEKNKIEWPSIEVFFGPRYTYATVYSFTTIR